MMIRVALVAHLSEVSGAGVALIAAAAGVSDSEVVLDLIVPGDGPLVEKARKAGLNPQVIHNPEVSFSAASFIEKACLVFERLRYLRELTSYLRRSADLVVVNSTASVMGGLAARLAGKPIVWWVHETFSPHPTFTTRVKLRIIEHLSAGILYVAESSRSGFPAPTVPRQLVVRNGVDVERFARATRSDEWENRIQRRENTRVLTSNGMFPRKAPDLFLESARILLERMPDLDFRCVITGAPAPQWDSFAADIRNFAGRAPLAGKVIFPGAVENMATLFASTDVYVSPSHSEALPISIIEAMAAAVPVVATDVGDCAQLLGQGTFGIVIPPGDPIALANALENILNEPDEARARATLAQRAVLQQYANKDFWRPLRKFLTDTASLD